MERLTVYVVDDSRDTADSLVMLLQTLGHDATASYDGTAALALIDVRTPDCVILDIAMSGMDGLELVNRLRARFGDDIVLVAITGSPSDDPTVRATFTAVDHYFEKPVTLENIRKLFPQLSA